MGTKKRTDGNSRRKCLVFFLGAIISITLISVTAMPIIQDSRAYLVTPRFGSPSRIDPYFEIQDELEQNNALTLIVGVDPSEKYIPTSWLKISNWEVGLSTSYLQNASIQTYDILVMKKISNPFTSEGMQDSSPLAKNALEITVDLGSSPSPGLYNVHIAYNAEISGQSLIVQAGDYIGPRGSASGSTSFILSEPNCVYISSDMDTLASENTENGKIPFSLIHVSDVHLMLSEETSVPLNKYRLDSLMQ